MAEDVKTDKPKTEPPPKTTAEITAELLEPFPPELVKWRIDGKISGGKAGCVAYVDARTVIRRLNGVLGIDGWKTRMRELGTTGSVFCRLYVKFPAGWGYREDVGGASSQPDQGDKSKAAVSDALKRAAVQFGVGQYLYEIPRLTLKVEGNQIAEEPKLDQRHLPTSYRWCGPESAITFGKLVDTVTAVLKTDRAKYVERLLNEVGYQPEWAKHLGEVQRRHMQRMMKLVNADLKPAANVPRSEPSSANAPANGTELQARVAEYDAKCAKAGRTKSVGEILAALIAWGMKSGYGANVVEWNVAAIKAACEFVEKYPLLPVKCERKAS